MPHRSSLGIKDQVLGVRLDGDRAVMEVVFGGQVRRMTTTRERGEWEIAQGTPRYYEKARISARRGLVL